MNLSYEQLGGTVDEIAALMADWTSHQVEDYAGSEILAAAVMAGRRSDDGRHDRAAMATYKVLSERGEKWRYQRAHNQVVSEQGYSVSEADREAARPR